MKITPQKNATDLIKDERLECQIGKKKTNATDLKKDEHPNICFSIYELKSTKNSILLTSEKW